MYSIYFVLVPTFFTSYRRHFESDFLNRKASLHEEILYWGFGEGALHCFIKTASTAKPKSLVLQATVIVPLLNSFS